MLTIGIVGGDVKRTTNLIEKINEMGFEVLWQVPALTTRMKFSQADILLVLVDYCGHSLHDRARTFANNHGAQCLTASIHWGTTREVLMGIKARYDSMRTTLCGVHGTSFLTKNEVTKKYVVAEGTLVRIAGAHPDVARRMEVAKGASLTWFFDEQKLLGYLPLQLRTPPVPPKLEPVADWPPAPQVHAAAAAAAAGTMDVLAQDSVAVFAKKLTPTVEKYFLYVLENGQLRQLTTAATPEEGALLAEADFSNRHDIAQVTYELHVLAAKIDCRRTITSNLVLC